MYLGSPALADHNLITGLDSQEGRGAVDRDHLVAFLITTVLGDVVKVITAMRQRLI